MSKLKNYLKAEMDTEILAGLHAIGMIFFYGLELYIYGVKCLQYSVIFQMLLLGYAIAWIQRILFIKNKVYEGLDYKVRVVLWNVLPIVLTVVCGVFLNWYSNYPAIIWIVFLSGMLGYYIALWIILQTLYQDETKLLNEKLELLKKENKRKGVE